jgi:hypothetical protein
MTPTPQEQIETLRAELAHYAEARDRLACLVDSLAGRLAYLEEAFGVEPDEEHARTNESR